MMRVVAIVLLMLAANGQAANVNSFEYFGFSVQYPRYDEADFALNLETATSYSIETEQPGWRFFIGHHFNKYVAIETGITYFGEASVIQDIDDGAADFERGEFNTLSGDLRFIGTLPFGEHFFLRAQVGYLFWNNQSIHVAGSSLLVEERTDTGNSPIAALGMGYGFSDKIALTLDYEQTEILDVATEALSLSFLIRF